MRVLQLLLLCKLFMYSNLLANCNSFVNTTWECYKFLGRLKFVRQTKSCHSKILLIQIALDWTGTELMNILYYQTVPILT